MDIGQLIEATARDHGLAPELVRAVVTVESSGNPWAYNPEAKYRWFWDVRLRRPFRALVASEIVSKFPPSDFYDLRGFKGVDADQEWWAQQASWGLMQVMGALARERGFSGTFLTELSDPAINLSIGCGVLAGHLKWAGGDTAKALAAYNAGRGNWGSSDGQRYAMKVASVVGSA